MKFCQEVTSNWLGNIPNHTYLLTESGDRMWGYVPSNSNELKLFKSPLPFDARRRKFKTVPNVWGWTPPAVTVPKNAVAITGSRGDTYTVELDGGRYTCTCSGFRFRSICKHINEVKTSGLIKQTI